MEASLGHTVIVVIEDDPYVRDLLCNVLSDEGYNVIAAANGEDALITLGTVCPALITLDLDLPGMTGTMILTELRRRHQTSDVPVVIVSAARDIGAEVRDMAQAVVGKPFDLDELLRVLHTFAAPPARTEQSVEV
jgi:two-component system, OmpR family, phosphate regulon response regulator PhoB